MIYGRRAHTVRHCIPPYALKNNWNLITDTVKRIRNIDLQLYYTRCKAIFKDFLDIFTKISEIFPLIHKLAGFTYSRLLFILY